jgi:antitoxin component of MazEF toxin-antitoxin module
MEAVRERIQPGGMIQIPQQLMKSLGLAEGDEISLRTDAAKLVIVPAAPRKRVRLNSQIVDALVEHEELFEPEIP